MTRIGDPIAVEPVLVKHRPSNRYTFEPRFVPVRAVPPQPPKPRSR